MWTGARVRREDLNIRLGAATRGAYNPYWGQPAVRRVTPLRKDRHTDHTTIRCPIKSAGGIIYLGVFEPETDPAFSGHYNASVADLPGCQSCGENLFSAIANLRNALDAYLEDMAREAKGL